MKVSASSEERIGVEIRSAYQNGEVEAIEVGRDGVVLESAVPEEGQDCTECLGGPNLVTFFVKKS